ncbi:ABC transporter permease [Pseudonocardia acaciae]|uniref:ABC transporter permease n=1 Tax=Pseudonocardia acaciae TaxID=551276 RepID=UPI0007E8C846|nr:ABC transporter permease [Pseudonocardia acaciae]
MPDPVDPPSSAGVLRRQLWIVRRLVLGLVTLLLVSILVFVATQVLPGDPARAVLGHDATPDRVALLREHLGLDRPLAVQYLSWLGDLLRGNLGDSLVTQESVARLIGDRTVNSAILVLLSAAIGVPLATFVGAVSGRRRDRWFDHTVLAAALALTALPEFIIALILVILFATTAFQLLPGTVLLFPGQNPLSNVTQLILPVAALVLGILPYLARLVRGSVIDVYQSEYVRNARLKGVSEPVVLRRHVLRNALVPAIQGTALALAFLTGGVVIIEQVFNYPGLGSALVDAVNNRDLPVIQVICLIFAASYVVFNLLGDVLTVFVTPRLRTAGA